MDGLLVIDKPVGPTSHDVVARMRRALGEKRIGHTGTLDPMASGVLPLVVGVATRLARFHSASAKRYRATVALGATTDTYDALGTVTWQMPSEASLPTREAVAAALGAFRGAFSQVPPAFSAKKVDGDRAYALARRGAAPDLAPVAVTVERLELVGWAPGEAVLDLTCGAGFYVRSLAHDLGQALGCGAHLTALRRTASGRLDESLAIPLDTAERAPDEARGRLVPLSRMLGEYPAVVLNEQGVVRTRHGNLVRRDDTVSRGDFGPDPEDSPRVVRLVTPSGDLLAIAEVGALQPSWPLHPGVVLA